MKIILFLGSREGGHYLICIKSNVNCTNGASHMRLGEKKEKIQKGRRKTEDYKVHKNN